MRNHDVAANARLSRVSGYAVGKIAGAGAPNRVETKLNRLADSNTDDALFVGVRRIVARIVLDPQFRATQLRGQSLGALQRGEAGMKSHLRIFNRKQILISPQTSWPARD